MLFRSPDIEDELPIGGRELSPEDSGVTLSCPSVLIPQQLRLRHTFDSEPEFDEETPLVEVKIDELDPLPTELRPPSDERLKYFRIPFLFFRSTVLFR